MAKNMCISALVSKSVNSQEIAKTIRNVLKGGCDLYECPDNLLF
jgi:hypothetical protein